jgi:cytochrome P450
LWLATGTGGTAFLEARDSAMLAGPTESNARQITMALRNGRTISILTNYQKARTFLTDSRHSRALAAYRTPIGPVSVMSITELDPPRHTFIRRLLNRMYSYKAIKEQQPQIQFQAARLVRSLLKCGSPADFMAEFCLPFAFSVQCDVLGVPGYAREIIQERSIARSGRPGLTADEIYEAEIALHHEVSQVIDYIRRRGGGGIYAELIAMAQQNILTTAELTGVASSLFLDGPLLAAAQIANSVLGLILYPQQLQLVARHPNYLDVAVEELIRWCPSITLGMPRVACTSFDGGDSVIEAGELAAVGFGHVNRDEKHFSEPECLNVMRNPNGHLTFGRGIHHCLGAHLMRLELKTALGELLPMMPSISLAVDEAALQWAASHSMRWLPRLPIQWTTD